MAKKPEQAPGLNKAPKVEKAKNKAEQLREALVNAMTNDVHQTIMAVYIIDEALENFKTRGEVKLSLYDTDSAPMTVGYNNHSVGFTMPHLLAVGEHLKGKSGTSEQDVDGVKLGLKYAVQMLMLKRKDVTSVNDTEFFQIDIGEETPEDEKQAVPGTETRTGRMSKGQNVVFNQPLHEIEGFPEGIDVMTSEDEAGETEDEK